MLSQSVSGDGEQGNVVVVDDVVVELVVVLLVVVELVVVVVVVVVSVVLVVLLVVVLLVVVVLVVDVAVVLVVELVVVELVVVELVVVELVVVELVVVELVVVELVVVELVVVELVVVELVVVLLVVVVLVVLLVVVVGGTLRPTMSIRLQLHLEPVPGSVPSSLVHTAPGMLSQLVHVPVSTMLSASESVHVTIVVKSIVVKRQVPPMPPVHGPVTALPHGSVFCAYTSPQPSPSAL
jgi:hypothetical protein